MASYDFAASRLHVDGDLRHEAPVDLDRTATNYLLNVLRLGAGAEILVFNGRDGEWRARIETTGRKSAILHPVEQTRAQTRLPDLHYLFAPLKHARLDYMVQKAVEMGVGALRPVITRRTVATRVNLDRMLANVVEAAEQCGILTIPTIHPEAKLEPALAALDADRMLVFCDEDAPGGDAITSLREAGRDRGLALLVGPEGGFAPEERALLLGRPGLVRLSLGPRILRADTAAVAALALLQATLGDWA